MTRPSETEFPAGKAIGRDMRLRLYVTGKAPNSVRAMANLRAICTERLDDRAQVEVIDVLQEPQRALADQVLVTPTLMRLAPEPVQWIFGDLSRREEVWVVLSG